jgi:hypothetical protein
MHGIFILDRGPFEIGIHYVMFLYATCDKRVKSYIVEK